MSEKKTTPCMEGLVTLTEAELDAVSGGVPFGSIIRASIASFVSEFVSEAFVSRTSATSSGTSTTSSVPGSTVTRSSASSASNGTDVRHINVSSFGS